MKKQEKLNQLMQLALERYSAEEILSSLLDNVSGYKTMRTLAEVIVPDEYLMDEIVFTAKYSDKLSTEAIEGFKDALEFKGYECIDCSSLAIQYKVEQLLQEIESNPYQIKLIA